MVMKGIGYLQLKKKKKKAVFWEGGKGNTELSQFPSNDQILQGQNSTAMTGPWQ